MLMALGIACYIVGAVLLVAAFSGHLKPKKQRGRGA